MRTIFSIKEKMQLRPLVWLTLMISVIILSSCTNLESDMQKQQQKDDKIINDYLTTNHIDAIKDSNGFYYQKLYVNKNGETLHNGEVVNFYYTIRLLDSTLVGAITDTSANPARCLLDYYSIVPRGLYYGMELMKTGDKYRFYIPSTLAYSQYSTPLFGSYSNFIIDVEIVSHQSVDDLEEKQLDSIQNYVQHSGLIFKKLDDGLYYRENKVGTGVSPTDSSQVTFNFTRRYLDSTIITTTIGSDPVTLIVNSGDAVKGLEEGLLTMKVGGKAQFIMPSSIGFKQSVCVVPESLQQELYTQGFILKSVLPFSIIMYDVELIKVE